MALRGMAYCTGLVPFHFIQSHPLLPPPSLLLLPLSHPPHLLRSYRRQQCCLGVIICSQCAITQHLLLHILPDTCTRAHTNAHVNTRRRTEQYRRAHTNRHGRTDGQHKTRASNNKGTIVAKGGVKRGSKVLLAWRGESLRSLPCYHYLTSPSFSVAIFSSNSAEELLLSLQLLRLSKQVCFQEKDRKEGEKNTNLTGIKMRRQRRLCERRVLARPRGGGGQNTDESQMLHFCVSCLCVWF